MCGSGHVKDKFEGLTGEYFRVYIRIDNLDIPEKYSDEEINKEIIAKGRLRFIDLMKRVLLSDAKNESFIKEISDKNYDSKIRLRKFRETFVEAYIDFKMDKITKDKYRTIYPEIKKENDE
jgi:S-adenosylmethionine:tRNA-ribosyltransferase-isomerase (queuine synthetase)